VHVVGVCHGGCLGGEGCGANHDVAREAYYGLSHDDDCLGCYGAHVKSLRDEDGDERLRVNRGETRRRCCALYLRVWYGVMGCGVQCRGVDGGYGENHGENHEGGEKCGVACDETCEEKCDAKGLYEHHNPYRDGDYVDGMDCGACGW